MTRLIPFENSYANLPARFYTQQAALPVRAPHLIRFNRDLAAELDGYRVAGDWRVYVELLRAGHVAHVPHVLNRHRIHASSLSSRFGPRELSEVERLQDIVATFLPPSAHRDREVRRYRDELRDLSAER